MTGRSLPARAQPLALPGVPNCHRLSADVVRGAQPTREGLVALQGEGIVTVVNLRAYHSDEKLGIADLAMGYHHISFKTWHPKLEHVQRFLDLATDPSATPLFVHCQHGADRTGVMCAAYRMVVQAWPTEDAVEEMVFGGFGHHRRLWRHLAGYVRRIDVEGLRAWLRERARPVSIDPAADRGR